MFEETIDSRPGTWKAQDAWASEMETGHFMYGLVRLLKPQVVIETGCHTGQTSREICSALVVNRTGFLYTCDTNPDMVRDAINHTAGQPILVSNVTGEELCRNTPSVDLAFIDSSGDRVAECMALQLSPIGIVVLHDARRPMLQEIVGKTGWQQIFVDSPRGLAILQPKRQF